MVAASHPGPSAVVTAAAVLVAIAAGLPPARIVGVGVVILAGQLSIGWSNDALDARRDSAVGRTDKPVARGAVPLETAWGLAIVAVAVSLVGGVVLSLPTAVANLVALAGGWSYNAVLKRTVLSWLPFAVSFGLLPSIVTTAGREPEAAAWWATLAAALIGVAAHATNVLPDLADDRATGIAGLPHRVGSRVTGLAAFGLLAAAAVVLAVGRGPDALGLALAGVGVAAAVVGALLVARGRLTRVLFRLVMAAALVDVALLVVSGGALAG